MLCRCLTKESTLDQDYQSEVHLALGSSVTLDCGHESDPRLGPAKVTWSKQEVELASSDDAYLEVEADEGETDGGEFRCSVQTSRDRAER